jgi:hypothetical protein
MPHPVNIATVASHAIDTRKGGVEFLAEIVLHAPPVALYETVSASPKLSPPHGKPLISVAEAPI